MGVVLFVVPMARSLEGLDLSDSSLSASEKSDLVFKNAREQAKLIADGELTSEELVHAHLDQIERVNPSVNAMVTMVADSALDQACEADMLV